MSAHDAVASLVNAAADNNVERMHALFRKGVSPDSVHPQTGRYPIHEAAIHGNEAALRALIAVRCNMRAKTMMGRHTALHLAAMNGNEIIIRILLRRGCPVNLWNRAGQAPIHLASNASVCYTLMQYGVDPFMLDGNNRTPLACASSRGASDVVEMLQEAQEKILRVQYAKERKQREERRVHLEAARKAEEAIERQKEAERLKRAYLRHRWA